VTVRSDADIWADVLQDKAAAWAELVQRYEKLVYAVASRAGLSYADVADCFQATWVQLYQARKRIQEPERLSAWLVTTARREALKLKRKSQRHGALDDGPEPIDQRVLPDEALERLQRQDALERGIAELDERCRELVHRLFFADEKQTYDAIAKSLGVSPNTLGPARKRCLERLRKILERGPEAPARKPDDGAL